MGDQFFDLLELPNEKRDQQHHQQETGINLALEIHFRFFVNACRKAINAMNVLINDQGQWEPLLARGRVGDEGLGAGDWKTGGSGSMKILSYPFSTEWSHAWSKTFPGQAKYILSLGFSWRNPELLVWEAEPKLPQNLQKLQNLKSNRSRFDLLLKGIAGCPLVSSVWQTNWR